MTVKARHRAPLILASLAAVGLLVACGSGEEEAGDGGEAAAGKVAKTGVNARTEPKIIPAPSDVSGAPANAERSDSGLAWRVLKPGSGEAHPEPASRVEVHYTGWTTDGNMFDSSVVRGKTATFAVNRVIKGWTEGLQLMVVGEKRRFWIPPELAYKNSNRPGAPQGMLVFDVELIEIKD